MATDIEKRIFIEALTGRQTRVDGSFRKRNDRSTRDSYLQGFPVKLGHLISYYHQHEQYDIAVNIMRHYGAEIVDVDSPIFTSTSNRMIWFSNKDKNFLRSQASINKFHQDKPDIAMSTITRDPENDPTKIPEKPGLFTTLFEE